MKHSRSIPPVSYAAAGLTLQLLMTGVAILMSRSVSTGFSTFVFWLSAAGIPAWIHAVAALSISGWTEGDSVADRTGFNHRLVPSYRRCILPVLELAAIGCLAVAVRVCFTAITDISSDPVVLPPVWIMTVSAFAVTAGAVLSMFFIRLSSFGMLDALKAGAGFLLVDLAGKIIFLCLVLCTVSEWIEARKAILTFSMAGFGYLGFEILFHVAARLFKPSVPGTKFRIALETYFIDNIMHPSGTGKVFLMMLHDIFGFDVSKTVVFNYIRTFMLPFLAGIVLFIELCTCFFLVASHQQAVVHTRFGKITGETENRVRLPGGPHFAFPNPVDVIYHIPTTTRSLVLDRAFYLENKSDESVNTRTYAPKSFVPSRDGSLITADKNIVQGVWTIQYRVGNPTRSVTGGDEDILAYFTRVTTDSVARKILRGIGESAVVAVIARTPVADFVAGRIDNGRIKNVMSHKLDSLQCGLYVTDISTTRYMAPRILEDDFQAVNKAQSKKALEVEKAVRNRVSTLSEMAGNRWNYFLSLLDTYEQTRRSQSADCDSAFEAIENFLLSEDIGGYAAQICERARMEKTATIEKIRSGSERFEQLLHVYHLNPTVFTNQLLHEALQELLSSRENSLVLTPADKTLYLDTEP